MRAFVGMQRYIAASMEIFQRFYRVELQQLENIQWMQSTDNKIEAILEKIEENSPQLLPEQVFPTGCVWDAWTYVSDLVRLAKNRIILIDNFVDDRVLSMLTKRPNDVSAHVVNAKFIWRFHANRMCFPVAVVSIPSHIVKAVAATVFVAFT